MQCVIVKSGDDCRQELLAMQLIRAFHDIFGEAQLPLWLRPFEVRRRGGRGPSLPERSACPGRCQALPRLDPVWCLRGALCAGRLYVCRPPSLPEPRALADASS